jgi:hypothetical protein
MFFGPPQGLGEGKGIPYQQISKQNFKGTPEAASPGFAQSYISVGLDSEVKNTGRKDGTYEARIFDITYKVTFVEEKSWWKDKTKNGDLLKHEQGHFDLAEAKARELNSRKQKIIESLKGEGATPDEALAGLHEKLNAHVKDYWGELTEMSDRYDNETDYGKNKEKQKEWAKKINDALANSRPFM